MIVAKKLEIIGVCRFSFLGFSDWTSHSIKVTQKPKDEIVADNRRLLFQPDRLERRFRTFEGLTLPSLAAQTDKDFRLIALTSDELPEPYVVRLKALAKRYPFIVPAFRPVGGVSATVAAIYKELGLARPNLLQFRLDDDDAVGKGYIQTMRRLGDGLAALVPGRTFSITFPRMCSVMMIDGELKFRKRHMLNASMGQAVHSRDRTVLYYVHHLIDRQMMILSDTDQWVLATYLHEINDSGVMTDEIARKRGFKEFGPGEFESVVAEHFPFLPTDPAEWAKYT